MQFTVWRVSRNTAQTSSHTCEGSGETTRSSGLYRFTLSARHSLLYDRVFEADHEKLVTELPATEEHMAFYLEDLHEANQALVSAKHRIRR